MASVNFSLAQINIGKILAPLDNPVMKDFVDNLERINSLAEESDGFVWRLKDDTNSATSIRVFEDDMIIVNMSMWKSAEHLISYVYKSDHAVFLRRRKEWFEKFPKSYTAMWYEPFGVIPTVQDAVKRLEHLDAHGDTPFAFTFKQKFTLDEAKNFIP